MSYQQGDLQFISLERTRFMFTLMQITALVGGFIVMLVQGSLYVFGTMSPYILTYLHYQAEDQDLTISDLSIINTLALVFTNFGIFIVNFKIFKFPHRVISLIAVLGMSLSTLALSFVKSFALYIILYGFVFGFFIGFGYLAPLKNTYEHLPNRKGLCSGTCLMGFGMGALVFNFILVAIVNPDNLKQEHSLFPREVGDRLPEALRYLALIYAGIGALGITLSVKANDKVDVSSNPLLQISENEEEEEMKKVAHFSPKILKYIAKHKIPLLLALLSFTCPFGIFMAFHFKEYGGLFIKDDQFLSLLGSIGSVFNGIFRVILGATLDRLSFRKIMLLNIIVFILSCGTIVWSVREKATYFISVVLTYGCYGSLFSIFPTQTVRILGKVIGPKMYYITFGGFSLGSIMQYLFHKFLVSSYGEDGYTYCFIIFGVFQLISLALVILVKFTLHPAEQKLLLALRQPAQIQRSREDTNLQCDTLVAQRYEGSVQTPQEN